MTGSEPNLPDGSCDASERGRDREAAFPGLGGRGGGRAGRAAFPHLGSWSGDRRNDMRFLADVGQRLRWAWLLITLILGFAVIASALTNLWTARSVRDSIERGQAQSYLDAILRASDARPGRERSGAFEQIVRANRESGLRYVGLYDAEGRAFDQGGVRAGGPVPPGGAPGARMVDLGTRVRYVLAPPRRTFVMLTPRDNVNMATGPRIGDTPVIVLEFEPKSYEDLRARAVHTLLAALGTALALIFAGIGFWRATSHLDRQERRMEAERRLATLGQMSAVLAHEIRNPLASLKGHAELLGEQLPEGSPEARKANRMVLEVTRLETLTTDLLEFARSGPMTFTRVPPARVLRRVVDELAPTRIEVRIEGAPETWSLDERRFGSIVLGNLLRNALDALPAERGPVATVALEAGQLAFTVRDFGPGLPSAVRERIFEPFVTTHAHGTGLGLAVAKRIVELHGGTIEARDAEGGGAEFRIVLPAREG
jgi:two-component system, NtrC family, sensor histidine kinase HydH